MTQKEISNQFFHTLVENIVRHTGQELFEAIVAHLCTFFDCEYAIIGRRIDSKTIRTLAVQTCDEISENFSYNLKGTPCHQVIHKSNCIYKENITDLFPEDQILKDMKAEGYLGIPLMGSDGKVIGILSAISRKKLYLPHQTQDIMNLLQTRLTSEIERIYVSEQNKKLERQLQQSHKMEAIGTLAGGIAHDFNNILGGILGFSELLQEDLKEMGCSPDILDNVDYILQGAERARDLVDQILAFSRADLEKLRPIQVDLIAKEIIHLLRASLPSTIKIEKSFFTNSKVLADATKIHQIFMNLCTNAGYAMRDKGGTLSISMKDVRLDDKALTQHEQIMPGNFLHLSVEDTGHGMSREIINKMMDPFFTTKPKEKGTGMGLWVVHGIIKNMGGFIDVTSKIGQGSRFDVYLPVYSEISESEIYTSQMEIPGGDETILFVDDEKSLTQLAKVSLTNLGYSVITYTDSREALDYFKHNFENVDVVITDMTMPEMTGDVFSHQIRLIKPGCHVILCTGFKETIEDKKDKLTNYNVVLYKPISLSDMAGTIRNLIDRKK